MNEIWKDIKGYENVYQVSNMGRVKRLPVSDALGHNRKEKILTLCSDGRDGYLRCILCKDGVHKHVRIHRVVAETFISNIDCKPCVNHIDGDKTNNSVENLEWCTHRENTNHAITNGLLKTIQYYPKQRLTQSDVVWIKSNCIKGDRQFGIRPIAKKFNVTCGCISAIVHNRNWRGVDNYDTI